MFARKLRANLVERAVEEELYEIIASELQAGVMKEGLWLKAVSRSQGNDSRIKSEYLKLRVQSLKDEMKVRSELDAEQTRQRSVEETARDEKVLNVERADPVERANRQERALAGLPGWLATYVQSDHNE